MRVWPRLNIFIDSLENRAAQFQFRIDFVDCSSPLHVERSVIFRQNSLAIRLFSHFDICDWITALFDVSNFRGGIVRRAVEDSDGNHRRQVVCDAARVKEIEAGVLGAATGDHVVSRMPRVDGGACSSGLRFGVWRAWSSLLRTLADVRRVLNNVRETRPQRREFLQRVRRWHSQRNFGRRPIRACRRCWMIPSSRCERIARQSECQRV